MCGCVSCHLVFVDVAMVEKGVKHAQLLRAEA